MFRTALEALVALVLFGCIPATVKAVDANPFTIGIFRLAVATAGIAALSAARRDLKLLPFRDLARLALIGLLFFGHWLSLFFAIKTSSASIGAIGLSTYGIHLLVLGSLFAGQKIRPAGVVAVLCAAAGAVLVVPSFDLGNSAFAGMLLATSSAAMYAALPLLHQRWTHLSSTHRALGQFSFALLFFLLFLPRADWSLAPADWGMLAFLAIGPTLIAHTLWVRVTTRLSPSLTSVVYYGNIPVAIALGVVLLHEPLTARTLTGAAMIIAGGVFGLLRR